MVAFNGDVHLEEVKAGGMMKSWKRKIAGACGTAHIDPSHSVPSATTVGSARREGT